MSAPFDVYNPPRFRTYNAARSFAARHCGRCRYPGEATYAQSTHRSARALLALQAAMDAGDVRIAVYQDDNTDTSFDETGETDCKLSSGEWCAVGIAIQRRETWIRVATGGREDRWTDGYDCALWGIIGPAGDGYWLAVAAELYGETRK
jgi:hypothetical protein